MKSHDAAEARSLLDNPSLSETSLPDGTMLILDMDRHQVLSASPVGAFVIKELRGGVDSLPALTARIVAEFDVEAGQAERDVAAFLRQVVEALSPATE